MCFDKCAQLEDPWDNWQTPPRSLGGCPEHLPIRHGPQTEPQPWQHHGLPGHLAISFNIMTEHMGPLGCSVEAAAAWTNLFLVSLLFCAISHFQILMQFHVSVIGMEELTAAT